MCIEMKDIVDLIGRVLLSFIFLYEAYDSIFYFQKVKDQLGTFGYTNNQTELLVLGIILLLFGGLMILLGYRTTLGATLLLIYWIPVMIIKHDFWNATEIEDYRLQSLLFVKNLAIAGAMLKIAASNGSGAGKYSMRRLLSTTKVR
jgi:putative oxidoreductase